MNSTRSRHLLAGMTALVLALTGALSDATAQDLEAPRGRQGYYLGIGLLGTSTVSSEDGKSLGPWGGTSFALRLGQLVTRRFGLGLQLDGGSTKGDGQTAGLGGLNLEAQWTLWRNLAVKGGPGIGFVQLKDPRVEDEETRGGAGGQYTLGVSYDLFASRNRLTGGYAVTPSLSVRYLPSDGVNAFVTLVGVEILWWTGLPRDQLQLPDADAYQRR